MVLQERSVTALISHWYSLRNVTSGQQRLRPRGL